MPAAKPRSSRRRTHPTTGWAYAGSQRQMQAFINTPALTPVLDSALTQELPVLRGAIFEWLSPLAPTRYAEFQDASFWAGIGHAQLAAAASEWWPSRGGPSWDAVGTARQNDGASTLVLVEAKAHTAEFCAAPCTATSGTSINLISAAFDQARGSLGSTATTQTWMGGCYQLANRLTWALWLRDHGVPTVFAHILFSNDSSNVPTGGDALIAAARAAHTELGIPHHAVADWSATIVLDAVG